MDKFAHAMKMLCEKFVLFVDGVEVVAVNPTGRTVWFDKADGSAVQCSRDDIGAADEMVDGAIMRDVEGKPHQFRACIRATGQFLQEARHQMWEWD